MKTTERLISDVTGSIEVLRDYYREEAVIPHDKIGFGIKRFKNKNLHINIIGCLVKRGFDIDSITNILKITRESVRQAMK